MLHHFVEFVVREDPDILQGHNVDFFDHPYVATRYKILLKYPCWGRVKGKEATVSKSFKSNTPTASVIGRVSVDSCTILKREVKSNSYKLDDLGKNFSTNPKFTCRIPKFKISTKQPKGGHF